MMRTRETVRFKTCGEEGRSPLTSGFPILLLAIPLLCSTALAGSPASSRPDFAGQLSQGRAVPYQVDWEPPQTVLKNPPTKISASGKVVFEWGGQDGTPEGELEYSYRLDGGDWSSFSSQTRETFQALSVGSHALEVRARDRNRNVDPTPAMHWFQVAPPFWKREYTIGLLLSLALAIGLHALMLSRDNARLKEVDALKSEILASVSHDLNTPLSAALVHLDNLIDGIAGDLTGRQRRTAGQVKDCVLRLSRMIQDMLDLSRIEAGKMIIWESAFDLREAAREVVKPLRAVASQKGVDLRPVEAGTDAPVWADREKVVQALSNLVGNAVKYTPEGGKVEVRVEQKEKVVQVCVEDTGPGIPEAHQEKIFEKFHQVRPGQGAGLGLTIARKLAELHRGRLWVESRVGEGSKFFLALPTGHVRLEATQGGYHVTLLQEEVGQPESREVRPKRTNVHLWPVLAGFAFLAPWGHLEELQRGEVRGLIQDLLVLSIPAWFILSRGAGDPGTGERFSKIGEAFRAHPIRMSIQYGGAGVAVFLAIVGINAWTGIDSMALATGGMAALLGLFPYLTSRNQKAEQRR